jgi:ferredoxin/flavodoxin---NADP+ reductase
MPHKPIEDHKDGAMSNLAEPTNSRAAPAKRSGTFLTERVLDVTHYNDKLFGFRTTRTPSFRFQSGQFTMLGLEADGRPLLRAYSLASAYYDDHLEFLSIKVPDGPLTSRLQLIRPGDDLLVGPKPTGTLLLGNLRPGRRLFLLATGTGFAPFASILRDPETYERFESVIAVEGCRTVAELSYANGVVAAVGEHELLGEYAGSKLRYYATTTQETSPHQGRIPRLLTDGTLYRDLDIAPLDRETDRVMICGNPGMLADLTALLENSGFAEGNSGTPGDFVIEKAFAQR